MTSILDIHLPTKRKILAMLYIIQIMHVVHRAYDHGSKSWVLGHLAWYNGLWSKVHAYQRTTERIPGAIHLTSTFKLTIAYIRHERGAGQSKESRERARACALPLNGPIFRPPT